MGTKKKTLDDLWIKTSDELPKRLRGSIESEDVIICTTWGEITIASVKWEAGGYGWVVASYLANTEVHYKHEVVTHWMPLPALPD